MLSVQRRGRAHGSGRSRGGREMDGCVSGWIRVGGFSSLIAPLLCVLIKVSCDKTNVTNIFAGNKVREKKKPKNPNLSFFKNNHLATMGTGRGCRGPEEGTGQSGGRREAPGILPVPARCCTGARSPSRAPSGDAGLPGWSRTGALAFPHPPPPPAEAASAAPGHPGGERGGRNGQRALEQRTGVSNFSERKRGTSSFALERCVTISQTPTHAYRTASRALVRHTIPL